MAEECIPGICELFCGPGQYAHVEKLPPSFMSDMAHGVKAQKSKGQKIDVGEV
jgi:hypothetical protein